MAVALSVFAACDGSVGPDNLTKNLNDDYSCTFTYEIKNEQAAKKLINCDDQFKEIMKTLKEDLEDVAKEENSDDKLQQRMVLMPALAVI